MPTEVLNLLPHTTLPRLLIAIPIFISFLFPLTAYQYQAMCNLFFRNARALFLDIPGQARSLILDASFPAIVGISMFDCTVFCVASFHRCSAGLLPWISPAVEPADNEIFGHMFNLPVLVLLLQSFF